MSHRNLFLVKGLLALGLVWALAWGLMRWARAARPTPAKIIAFVEANPLSEAGDAEGRKSVIAELATLLNGLEASQVRELEERAARDPRRDFFEEMNSEEQRFFMERRVGRAFQQMMESFNEMDREERRRVVERSLKQMREERGAPARLEEVDPDVAERITEAGLEAYYEDASAETKIDLAPLLEEMQRAHAARRR